MLQKKKLVHDRNNFSNAQLELTFRIELVFSLFTTFNFVEMKTLTVTILLLCCHRCLGTFVSDLYESSYEVKDTFLAFGQGIEITNPLTFCLRFNIRSGMETNYIFSSTDEQLALILRFSVSQGLVLINRVALFFEIPKDNAVLPFRWHHICFTSNEDYYDIVLDGQQWYHANHTKGSFEKKKNVTRLDLGSTIEYWIYSDGINFRGLLSELNIWSKSLSVIQVAKITINCGKVDPIPDLLDWSELPSSMITGSKYNESIENICSQRNTTSRIYKVMPDLHYQDNAIHICKILNGELVSPNSLNELQTWNGKLSRMKCRNVNSNFPPLFVVLVSENACTYFAAPIKRSSNGSWINQNDNKIVDMDHLWNSHSPYGEDLNKCTGFEKDSKYYVTHCKSKTCSICAWTDHPVFNLRGLCPNTQVDEQYVLLPEKTFGGNVLFFGFKYNNILFNQETSSWQIVKNGIKEIFKPGGISTDSIDVVGTFKPDESNFHHFPVGTHFWNLTEDCNKVLQLKLTKV